MDFYWRNAPSVPTAYGTRNAFNAATGQTMAYDCSTDSAHPDWVSTNAPTWQATIGDVDGTNGANIDGEFNWTDHTTGTWTCVWVKGPANGATWF